MLKMLVYTKLQHVIAYFIHVKKAKKCRINVKVLARLAYVNVFTIYINPKLGKKSMDKKKKNIGCWDLITVNMTNKEWKANFRSVDMLVKWKLHVVPYLFLDVCGNQ